MSLTAPVTKDGFAFANGDLYADASGNRHRRATVGELKDHFKSGKPETHAAHWFEAQCIHYGIQPSKTKAIARMRLYDAVNAGKLSIPTSIVKLEGDLKKEWTKKDREAKKAPKGDAESTTMTKATGGKRKAENFDVTMTIGGINVTVSASKSSSQAPAKKTKTTTAAPKAKVPKTDTPGAAAPPKTTSMKKQTASRGGLSQGSSRGSAISSPAPNGRTLQTARRGGSFVARGRIPAPAQNSAHHMGFDEPPPPYSEHPKGNGYDDEDGFDNGHESKLAFHTPLEPLGLLNGRYNVDCPEVEVQWPHVSNDFGLIFTLSGSSFWGKFDLGIISGVLYFPERPYQSSHDAVCFTWRGREDQGHMHYGNNNGGWIRFLGGGRIEGGIDWQNLIFYGGRLANQGTRSEIEARTLQEEWSGYSAREYERENQARWS